MITFDDDDEALHRCPMNSWSLLRLLLVASLTSSCATVLDHQRLDEAPRAVDFPASINDDEALEVW